MRWANILHIYQPPHWPVATVRKVTRESYRPLLRILKRHARVRITLNCAGSLTEQLLALGYRDIIRDIRQLARAGQIELTGTAIYHPILPKLPESEMRRQIKLNTALNKKIIGPVYRPRGIFFPELAYSHRVARVAARLGFTWIVLDEIAYRGTFGRVSSDIHYRHRQTKQSIIFRNKFISDFLAFRAPLHRPNAFWDELKRGGRSKHNLVTAFDGEGLGHHRPGADKLWERLITDSHVEPITVSELITRYTKAQSVSPLPSSWSSRPSELKRRQPYILWDDRQNPIHPLQWQLLHKTVSLVTAHPRHAHYQRARTLLDQHLASDQFWWASAKPWWSKEIVDAKAQELAKIATLIEPQATWPAHLSGRIIQRTAEWQRSRKYKAIAKQYLASSPYEYVHYIGGKRITK